MEKVLDASGLAEKVREREREGEREREREVLSSSVRAREGQREVAKSFFFLSQFSFLTSSCFFFFLFSSPLLSKTLRFHRRRSTRTS
jgi:hypothetical protein